MAAPRLWFSRRWRLAVLITTSVCLSRGWVTPMGVLSPRAHAGDDATCSLCDVLWQRLMQVTMPHVCDVLWQRLGCGSHVAGVWPSSARSLCSSQPLSVCLSTSLSPPCSTRPTRPAPTHVTPPSHCSVTSPHRHSTPVCSRLMRLRIGLRGTTHTHTHTHTHV